MSNKRLIVFGSKISPSIEEGFSEVAYSNPNYWKTDGVRTRFTHVYAKGYPEIIKAYTDAGKQEYFTDETPAKTEDVNVSATVEIPETETEKVEVKPKRTRKPKQTSEVSEETQA